MVQKNRLKKVIVITGPTAIGKTNLSLKIAEMYKTEIINADASQFRKDLNIGTAKIDLNKTKIVHHLIDIISPTEDFSIKEYQILGRKKIDDMYSRGKIPLIVGGSLLYISSLLGDYNLQSNARDNIVEQKYDNLSNEELYSILVEKDYEAAKLVHYNNRRRVLRYLEILESGSSITANNQGQSLIYDALIISLDTDRNELYERINKRVEDMFNNGWIEETQKLIEKGIDISLIKEIGYKEISDVLNRNIGLNDAKEQIKQNTRHYAKRQLTWIRNKLDSHIIKINYENELETLKEMCCIINDFLKTQKS